MYTLNKNKKKSFIVIISFTVLPFKYHKEQENINLQSFFKYKLKDHESSLWLNEEDLKFFFIFTICSTYLLFIDIASCIQYFLFRVVARNFSRGGTIKIFVWKKLRRGRGILEVFSQKP
jgi:hypothetical protein